MSRFFQFVDSEHKLLKYLEDTDIYKEPIACVINIDKVELCREISEKRTHLAMTNIPFQIRKFLEVENV